MRSDVPGCGRDRGVYPFCRLRARADGDNLSGIGIEDAILAVQRVRLEVDHGAPDVSQHAFLVDALHPGAVIETRPKAGS